MSQETQPQQQIQAYAVQALWVQTAVTVLMAIGMICYFLAEGLKAVTGVMKKP